jgi:hypothetical protein
VGCSSVRTCRKEIFYVERVLDSPVILLETDDGWYPKAKTDASTTQAPVAKAEFMSTSWKRYEEKRQEINIESEVANPFITLSAYFTTTATICVIESLVGLC